MYKQSVCALAIATGVVVAAIGLLHSDPAPADACPGSNGEITEVADGVYVRQGQHGVPFVDQNFANVGFIVGRDCVAVIDTGSNLEEGEALRCAVKKTTEVPVCYVIVTHHHFDHALGNLAFKAEGVQFIGHERQARALAASTNFYLERLSAMAGKKLSNDLIVPPDRTVSIGAPLALDLGERVLSITAFPTAHTDNDLSIMDENTSTLWLSDLLFVEHIPTLNGSILGWLDVIETLKQQPAARAIPGHGPVQVKWPDAMAPQQHYLSTLRDEARSFIASGGGLQQATDTVGLDELSNWLMFDLHHKRNVTAAYTELEWE